MDEANSLRIVEDALARMGANGRLDLLEYGVTSLPPLPETVRQLFVGFAPLPSLPELPPNLEILVCIGASLTELPPLPATLRVLDCDDNQLTQLPPLPAGLVNLNCNRNELTELPPLPATLKRLNCGSNPITRLPALPEGLIRIKAINVPLLSLPRLPESLKQPRGNWDHTDPYVEPDDWEGEDRMNFWGHRFIEPIGTLYGRYTRRDITPAQFVDSVNKVRETAEQGPNVSAFGIATANLRKGPFYGANHIVGQSVLPFLTTKRGTKNEILAQMRNNTRGILGGRRKRSRKTRKGRKTRSRR